MFALISELHVLLVLFAGGARQAAPCSAPAGRPGAVRQVGPAAPRLPDGDGFKGQQGVWEREGDGCSWYTPPHPLSTQLVIARLRLRVVCLCASSIPTARHELVCQGVGERIDPKLT